MQDGVGDSTVRLISALEGFTKRQRRPAQAARVDISSLPPVVPLPKAQCSRKKRSFTQLLSNSGSSKQDDKENSSAAGNLPADPVEPAATGAAGTDPKAVRSAAPLSASPTAAVSKRAKPPKPTKQTRLPKCGHCKTCLKPKSKQACLTSAAERAVVQADGGSAAAVLSAV